MGKPKMKRILTGLLAGLLAVGAVVGVGAAGYMGDVSGDGKISAFDAQILAEAGAGNRDLNDAQGSMADKLSVSDILAYIFGDRNLDAGDMDSDGITEIYNAAGLQYMAQYPDGNYILADNIDLQGAEWTPISLFSGTFDGNGYTISNLTISQSVPNSSAGKEFNQGFFGGTSAESVVNDLALRNVTLNAAADAQFIGLVAGTARGTITDCTVTGTIADTRTDLSGNNIYIGVLVGRTTKDTQPTTGGTTLTSADDTGLYTAGGLCADVKLYIEKDSATIYSNGLCGYLYPETSVTGLWRDSTNNATNESATMRARQQTVVDYMNAMATVAWTVPETMHYVASGAHNQVFQPGVTYYGLPYNGRNGSLERFMSCMDQVDGVNVATTRYGTVCEKDNPSGWMFYMGNDCSSAVGWAWMQVSPNRVNGGSESEYAGGAYVQTTNYMIPTNTVTTVTNSDGTTTKVYNNQGDKGIYPVGDWTTVSTPGGDGKFYNDDIVGTFAYEAPAAPNSADFLTLNGETVLAEAYAVARKADAIVAGDPAGHARLLVSYPVVIRKADGSIDLNESFLVCTEQGDGLYDGKNSSWRVNYKWTFHNLLGYEKSTTAFRYSNDVYLPITIRALRADYVKHAYVDEASSNPVIGPDNGLIYSNWRIESSTLIIRDDQGNELFRNQVYTGLATGTYLADGTTRNYDQYRSSGQYVLLSYAHGDAYRAFAAENLTEGQTYYYSVQVKLSNGQTLIISRDGINKNAYGHSGKEFDPFVYTAG